MGQIAVCYEGEELGGDVLDPGVDLGRALADDIFDLLPRGGSGDRVALNLDVNVDIVVEVVRGAGGGRLLVVLGNIDLGTRLLLQGLDGGALTADDVGAGRLGNGDVDGLLSRGGS